MRSATTGGPMEMLGNDGGRLRPRVGIGRSSRYLAVTRGDFDTIQANGRTTVLTLPLLRRMGLDVPDVELPGPGYR